MGNPKVSANADQSRRRNRLAAFPLFRSASGENPLIAVGWIAHCGHTFLIPCNKANRVLDLEWTNIEPQASVMCHLDRTLSGQIVRSKSWQN